MRLRRGYCAVGRRAGEQAWPTPVRGEGRCLYISYAYQRGRREPKEQSRVALMSPDRSRWR
jgi:hypothetical protein